MKSFKFKILSIFLIIVSLLTFTACKENNNPSPPALYSISNGYFKDATFKRSTQTNVDLKTGATTYTYWLEFTSSCEFPLTQYSVSVELYDDNNGIVDSRSTFIKETIPANTDFSFKIKVSNWAQAATSYASVVYTGSSPINPPSTTHKIMFVFNNGSPNTTTTVENGKTLPTPSDPSKPNYIFKGWYPNYFSNQKYDFSQPVNSSLTLYAKYEIDAAKVTNKISTDLIRGVVKIYNKSYNTFLGIETSYSTSQGSGFCFHIQDGYYYILTNCHVAKKLSDYDKQKITIEDYQGKQYTGSIYKNPNKTLSAIAAAYDLACIYFKPTSTTNIQKLNLGRTNPSVSDDVVSIGAPQGQSNSITYGKLIAYQKITLSNTSTSMSNVTFDVICHDASADGGSSGGPLLDSNLNVIGVHYAGSRSTNKEYAIPIEKVREFLTTFVYN